MKDILYRSICDYLENFGFSESARAAVCTCAEKMLKDDRTVLELCRHIEAHKEGRFNYEELSQDSQTAAERTGVHPYTAKLVYCIIPVPTALPYFLKNGLGEREWYDSMIDLRWKCDECFKVYGIYGCFVDWFGPFYTADRVAFGRLQFNLQKAPADYVSDRFNIKEGDTVIAIHIPSDTRTPFTREEREAAYDRARAYYAKHFADGRAIFSCGSWLINPEFEELLPESSNILSFTREFELYDVNDGAKNNIWRLFYVADWNGDPATLPEDTSLMRIYKKHLLAGGQMLVGRGYHY